MSTSEKILNVLARVPADHTAQLQAWSAIRRYRACALKAVASVAESDSRAAESRVQMCRLALLDQLVEIVEPLDGPIVLDVAKGGAL